MTELIILRGVPASGKSTWAKQSGLVRVNRDDIRHLLFGKYHGEGVDENIVTAVQHAAIKSALEAGQSVVDDNTNLNNQFLKKLIQIGVEAGATVSFKDFEVDFDTVNRWDCGRGERTVGESIIRRFYSRTNNGKLRPAPKIPEPLPVFEPYVADWSLPSAFIVDVDGTVANHEGVRNPYDTSRYHLDKPHEDVINLVNQIEEENYVIVVSGRSEDFYDVTYKWLVDNFVRFDELIMRKSGDQRNDAIIKPELFDEHIRGKFNVIGVLDDRARVVDSWRKLGLRVYQVATGNF